MSNVLKYLFCILLVLSFFGCSNEKGSIEQTETSNNEPAEVNNQIEEENVVEDVASYPIFLDGEDVNNWIDFFHGEWEWECGDGDSSKMCQEGNNAIILSIGHGDPDNYEFAYNINQCTGCCNDGIAYNISSIDQIDNNTYEVHLEQYEIIMPDDAGRSYQNFTLLPTNTYIIRKGNDDNVFFMQFKGLNSDTYKSFPDSEYMSYYEELYLKQDDWYEFKLFWRDGKSVEY